MKNPLSIEMLQATRLTVGGRLHEAAATLRRLLGGEAADKTPDDFSGTTIDGSAHARPVGAALGSVRIPAALRDVPAALREVPAALREVIERTVPSQFAPGGSTSADPLASPEVTTGQFTARSFTNAAGTRPYKLFVPSSYQHQTKPVPLIVMLHGCTQSADDFAAGTKMNLHAEQHGFLVAYPEQIVAANGQKCWNWFQPQDQVYGTGEPSLIAGITQQVMDGYAVDPRRVFVAGLSAGGAEAAILGVIYPKLYASIGVHSGLPYGAAHDVRSAFAAMQRGTATPTRAASRLVPTIIFHGDRDKTVNKLNADSVAAQAAQGAALSTHTEQGEVPGGHAFDRTLHTDSAGHTVIEQWTIRGGGHAWFGGSPAGTYTDARGPDATREMLRFFLEHPQAS